MFEKIFELIEKHDSIILCGHKFPDGDCFGSEIGLRDSLRLAFPNKKIYASGSGLIRFARLIGEMDIVSNEIFSKSLIILLDVNEFSRTEDSRSGTGVAFARIDHHIDNTAVRFTEGPQVVVDDASSTCELVFRMIQECKLPIDQRVASALYLGMLTDTGRFQYSEDFPKMFAIVSELSKYKPNISRINEILSTSSISFLQFKGYIFTHYQKTKHGFIYCYLTQKEVEQFGIDGPKAMSFINLIGNLEGFPVWGFFLENNNGSITCEFRSSVVNVQEIAVSYGGGGHLLAAGVTLRENTHQSMKEIVEKMDQSIVSYRENK